MRATSGNLFCVPIFATSPPCIVHSLETRTQLFIFLKHVYEVQFTVANSNH